MAKYLNTRGRSTLGIGLCDRCSRKFPIGDLYSDPNSPGLRVCRKDLDDYDPYRLAPRQTEVITLPFTRPDWGVGTRPAGFIAETFDEFITTEDGDDYVVFFGEDP